VLAVVWAEASAVESGEVAAEAEEVAAVVEAAVVEAEEVAGVRSAAMWEWGDTSASAWEPAFRSAAPAAETDLVQARECPQE
jgi:hypothetical protein